MQYWMLKSEPFKYSWERLKAEKSTTWDGVRNYQARNNLQAMKKGDLAFFYHSNEGLEIVGIAKITKEAYPDPTIEDARWVAVTIQAVKPLKKSVTLKDMKEVPQLKNLGLIRQGRLSVSPVTPEEWDFILKMGETKI